MKIWQADFYRRPLVDEQGLPLWELLVCDPTQSFTFAAFCSQAQADSVWLIRQLRIAAQSDRGLPDEIHLFRPQSLGLLKAAGQALNIKIHPTRRVLALKQWLRQRSTWYSQLPHYSQEAYEPVVLEQPPPQPLPEELWGEQWQFAAINAADVETYFLEQPIPIADIPSDLLPMNLGISSTAKIPGVVIEGGRQSMQLGNWLATAKPSFITPMGGNPGGLVLEADLIDRWILFTYDDPDISTAAQLYMQRRKSCQGLHFLLVQPDNSGMTLTGLWLLQAL